MTQRSLFFPLCLTLFLIAAGARGEEKAASAFTAEQVAFFEKQVQPLLRANCLKCHGDEKVRGGLDMRSRAGILKGGDQGPAVSLEKPETSRLLAVLDYTGDIRMPPKGKLPEQEIAILKQWVREGLPWKGGGTTTAESTHGITEADRNYWAYRPVVRPEVPKVKSTSWVRNPIDAFILAGVEAKGLEPAEPADRIALCRRVYYDLIGLPPTPAQVDDFVNDQRPDAYEKLIDRLLAMPQYGEKWGRHWLDLVRYAETHGYERDSPKPFAWRYRDYVIDAFNRDKPYDRFILEQLAGDELDEVTPETLTATGYYRLGIWDDEPADRLLAKYDVLDGVVATTGQVFMGMSLNCARCHTHKKDPIPHRDYYSFLAFFRDVTDMNKTNTRKVVNAEAQRLHQQQLARKESHEAKLYQEIYKLEQQLARANPVAEESVAPSLTDLTYRFYRDTWDRLPDFDSLKHETEGEVLSGFISLTPASRLEAFGLVFDGKLQVPQQGAYTFHLEATEGVRLKLAGKTVIDRPEPGVHQGEAKVDLPAGIVDFRLEYFNTYRKPRLTMTWSGADFTRRSLSDDRSTKGDLNKLMRERGPALLGEEPVKRYFQVTAQLAQSRQKALSPPGMDIMCVEERGRAPTHVLVRGNPHIPGEEVTPGYPEVLGVPDPKLAGGAPDRSSGKRRVLAQWLASPGNPLTARVLVNRLWQHHFGRGIVPSSNDFGKLGDAPTHPQLLDWLADEFVKGGWRIKAMHKLIMMSNAYRMSSKASEKAMLVDPGNTLFWRFNMRRLTGEEIRDSILAVSGNLNLEMAGPSIYPPIPRAVLAGQSRPGEGWGKSSPEQASRRSVYVHLKRSLLVPILQSHDVADTDSSCPVRYTTTVPTQSLGMLNGDFTNEQATLFAQRIEKASPGDFASQVRQVIRLTTGRVPTRKEVDDDVAFLRDLQTSEKCDASTALRIYCLLALNTNEFIYLD